MTFKIRDKGARDAASESGYAAASWHTFTRRSWARQAADGTEHVLTLFNQTNETGERRKVPVAHQRHAFAHRIVYRVTIEADGREVYNETDTNWIRLVRQAREWSYGQDPTP